MSDVLFKLSNGEEIPVRIETRRGMRNITLRPQTVSRREIRVSKPWITSTATALRFVEQKRAWLERIFAAAPVHNAIRDGDILEFFGNRVQIRHDSWEKSNFYLKSVDKTDLQILVIGGSPDMLEHRVRDFIKKEFLVRVKAIIKSAPPEFAPARISVRDTTSRWGSCSTTGTISFSWRLAFAPPDVMRYVIMHELAHKSHMDHSPAFWATVAELYGDGVGRAKRWLSQHGSELHQYC